MVPDFNGSRIPPYTTAASLLTHEPHCAEDGEASDSVGPAFPASAFGLKEILRVAAAVDTQRKQ